MRQWIFLFFAMTFSFNTLAASGGGMDFGKMQGRLFGSVMGIKPKTLNDSITTYNLQPYSKLYGYGFEIAQEFFPHINLGMRVEGKYVKVNKDSSVASTSTIYYSSISQTLGDGVLRIDVIKTHYFKFDLFGAVGLSSNQIEIHTSTTGEGNFVGNAFHQKAGGSIGIGFGGVYLMAEAGYDWNKLNNLKKTRSVPSGIDNIDLSGQYVAVGVILTGNALKGAGVSKGK